MLLTRHPNRSTMTTAKPRISCWTDGGRQPKFDSLYGA
jgi:hypothetical protein